MSCSNRSSEPQPVIAMNFRVVFALLCLSTMTAATSTLFSLLPATIPLTYLLPFPLALPVALVAPMSWALPLLVGLKGASLIGVGLGTGGFFGFTLAGLGAVGVKAALANAAALKLAGVGAAAVKTTAVAAAAAAGGKAAAKGAKAVVSKVAEKKARYEPVAPVLEAPVDPWKSVDPWKPVPYLPSGWDHAWSYTHPRFGYGYSRSSVELRRRRRDVDSTEETVEETTDASGDDATTTDATTMVSPMALKDIFQYVSTYDTDRCVQRVVCELAAQPDLIGERGKEVAGFMVSLSAEDAMAPWIPYREAAVVGQKSSDRDSCYTRYPTCEKSTETLVEIAKVRLSEASAPTSL
ncbi:hypothetical protein HPB47_013393 [Ixodes persulcatus]|uniref:Uncharacterized protein n=2 Tax=Ixodes persulcatus TaxID=34615 RepID=A0AC60QYK4_IXOPE|nr:hypothetical protein HPB47_013393 [Ixodes persulcatus]